MARTFEDGLKQFIQALGHVVERVIGQAKKARKKVDVRRGIKPVLSLESQLPQNQLRELISAASQNILSSSLPDLENANALDLGEGASPYSSQIVEHKAKLTISLEIGGASNSQLRHKYFTLKGSPHRLPFKNEIFDYTLARLATPFQGDIESAIQELGRTVKPGGRGLMVDYHPYGLYAKHGSDRLRSARSAIIGLEDYYRMFRKSGMRIIDLRESWIDETLRSYFPEEDIQTYRTLKGTPLIVFLFFYKPRRKT